MPKRVESVGFRFPGDVVDFVALNTKRSLLDADIVVFRPSVAAFYSVDEDDPQYQGKPSFDDDASFQLKDAASHWRQQIQLALAAGKTIFVFLPPLTEVWLDSGETRYSGTGKNARATRIVEPFDNYKMLPAFAESVMAAEGEQMKLVRSSEILFEYWENFEDHSAYNVVFKGPKGTVLATTATAEMPVACTFSVSGGEGRAVALPALSAYDADPEDYPANYEWKKEDQEFGRRLLASLVSIDQALRAGSSTTPPPDWAGRDEFLIDRERGLRQAILRVDEHLEAAAAEKAKLAEELASEGRLRALLYEKGKPLEAAVLLALGILGFSAETFRNAESDFDAVFVSPEGRFLGEAEGKDDKAINIDKLRQLEMNRQEDFAREEVTEFPRGVLFGNAYRLRPPEERPGEFFSAKCLTASARSGAALVRTIDLFRAAKHTRDTDNAGYKEACRRAILDGGGGVVKFPAV